MSGNRRDSTTTRNPIITRSEVDENYSSNDEEEGDRSDGIDGEFETTPEAVAMRKDWMSKFIVRYYCCRG